MACSRSVIAMPPALSTITRASATGGDADAEIVQFESATGAAWQRGCADQEKGVDLTWNRQVALDASSGANTARTSPCWGCSANSPHRAWQRARAPSA